MKQLRRKGLIEPLERNRLLIPDVSRLRALLPSAGEGRRASRGAAEP